MAIWFDVEDLLRYFCFNVRPTGIQRLSLALFREAHVRAMAGDQIYFCRRQTTPPYFRAVDFSNLDARLQHIIDTPPAPTASCPPAANQAKPQWLRYLSIRQRGALGRIRRAARELGQAVLDFFTPAPIQGPLAAGDIFDTGGAVAFAPGDWLINLGSSWNAPYQPASLAHLRACGAKFGVLVYDMIPELFPEWTARATLAEFRCWVRQTLPQADLLFAISDNTAADIRRCLRQAGEAVPPIARFHVGAPAPSPDIPEISCWQRPFVLLVSTFEVRKNHALMFRVWQTLLARHGAAQIPDLIFAGKPGWLTADLLCQFENAGWLNGKIRFCESPTDSELARLYQHCLFSVYPSLYEGWGLPVVESLSFGRTVAASNRASIPEAGGDFCVYFDPENIPQAVSVIEDLIQHPESVAALERHIALNYRPLSWQDAATSLLNALQPACDVPCEPALLIIHQAA